MKLSVKLEYASRVLARLAQRHGNGSWSHIEDLAKLEAVPQNFLVQILSDLRNGGLVVSKRGKQGGYSLAKDPGDILLVDIVRILQRDLLMGSSSSDGESGVQVSQIWNEIRDDFQKLLEGRTVEDFMPAVSDEMYYI